MESAIGAPKVIRDVSDAVPTSLDSFVGQENVLAAVKVALDASRNDDTRFPHALFVGPPGLGKSNLVQIIANELGVELRETLAQTLTQSSDVAALLLEAESRQIIFLDECDELDIGHQTLLYRALAERKLFLPQGRGNRAMRCLPLEDFTLVMASNHEGRLARPLVERFKMVCRFEFYSAQEIQALLADRVAALGWLCDDDVLPKIAKMSRGVPRIGLRLLESVRRTARSENAEILTASHFERMCRIEGLNGRGLDRTECSYMRILGAEGKAVRVGVIADRLGLPPRTVSGVIESFLVRERLISRTDDGRALTDAGVRYLQEIDHTSNPN